MKIVVAKETKARFSPMKRTANQKKKMYLCNQDGLRESTVSDHKPCYRIVLLAQIEHRY